MRIVPNITVDIHLGVTAHGLGYASPPYATPEAELTEQTPQQRITELVLLQSES